MRNLLKITALLSLLTLPFTTSKAQETEEDSLLRVIENLQSSYSKLSKIKISGYVQAQYQMADSVGAKGVSGGDFSPNIDNRFMVRRGRLKIAYSGSLSQYVLQIDANEDGVSVKDMYFKFTDPWTNAFSLTGGIFNRPFGHEIEYSSTVRESPERSRIFQTLLNGERDMGACLTFQPRKSSAYNFIKVDLGLFNGINKKDFDNKKDFIGRITLNKQYFGESLKVGVGASYYNGKVINSDTMKLYIMDGSSYVVDNARIEPNTYSKRIYKGLEAQLTYISPLGVSQLRGEYLWGESTGTDNSTKTFSTKPTKDLYLRNFSGWYVIYSQNILQLPVQFVAKYDVYDPNTKVSGKEIGINNKTNAGDIKYSTLGLGLIYRWDANVKITAYYDMVSNEKTNLKGNYTDLKDNVFTLRFQYKF